MQSYKRTLFACYFSNIAMAVAFVLPSMLFVTFHDTYGISYTLLGTLVLINFTTQLLIDLVFTFFSRFFNLRKTVIVMPILTSIGLILYAVLPMLFPQYAYIGFILGTVVFSVAAGLCEVLVSPIVAAIPSEHPEKAMSLLHSLYGWGVLLAVLVSTAFFLLFGTENWMYLTLLFAIPPLVTSVLFYLSPMPDMSLSSAEGKGKRTSWKALGAFALCIFFGGAAETCMTNWISGFMEIGLGIPKAVGDVAGLALFAFLLAMTRVAYAKFSPDITKTILVGMIGAAICYPLIALSGNAVISFCACVATGIFTAMLWPGTLILMEEKLPAVGVAAYALMAAAGDSGASVGPQLLGIVVDKVSASAWAVELSLRYGMTVEELSMKAGMLFTTIFPLLGIVVIVSIMVFYHKKKKREQKKS